MVRWLRGYTFYHQLKAECEWVLHRRQLQGGASTKTCRKEHKKNVTEYEHSNPAQQQPELQPRRTRQATAVPNSAVGRAVPGRKAQRVARAKWTAMRLSIRAFQRPTHVALRTQFPQQTLDDLPPCEKEPSPSTAACVHVRAAEKTRAHLRRSVMSSRGPNGARECPQRRRRSRNKLRRDAHRRPAWWCRGARPRRFHPQLRQCGRSHGDEGGGDVQHAHPGVQDTENAPQGRRIRRA